MSGTNRSSIDAPSRTDLVVRGLSKVIGGPHGAHSVEPPQRRFWIPPRVILLAAIIMFALAWLQKLPCADGQWTDFNQYTQLCYTDVRALWTAEHLNEGAIPYFDHAVEYPVLTGLFMGIFGLLAHGLLGDAGGTFYYHLNALALIGFGIAAVAGVYRLRLRRPWDAMMIACAPAVLITAVINWDLFAVSLTVLFMVAWARSRPIVAGVLLGLAVAAKFYPLLIAGPLLVLAMRHRRWGPTLQAVAVAVLSWLAANLPVMLLARDSWLQFFRLNSDRGIDWGTSWYVLQHFSGDSTLGGLLSNVSTLNWLYLVSFVACCIAIGYIGLFAPVSPRLAQLSFLVIAAFLLTGKVWSQQYVLWLLPLIVLARPRWRMLLVWQAAELFYFVAFYGELLQSSASDDNPLPAWALSSPEWVFILASISRLATVAIMCGLVIREIYQPERDVVRHNYGTDPDSGLLTSSRAI